MRLTCGNTLKSSWGARTFWVRATASVSAGQPQCTAEIVTNRGQWAIAIYKASTGQYSENELPASFGGATGTPEQGIDETFILYAGPPTSN